MKDPAPASLRDEAALITGSAVRIGRAVARSLADAGYRVAIHHRSSDSDADSLKAEIEQSGGQCCILKGDLAEPDVLSALVAQAADALRHPVTVLINNASVFDNDTAQSFTTNSWDLHQNVNLRAPLMLAQAMFDALPKSAGGNIINFIDQRVLKLNPQFFSYTISKAGLWTATRTLAQAMAPHVRVNAIGPGPTLENIHQQPGEFAAESTNVPLGKGPELEEIIHAVKFILETPSLTGQMLTLDGGQHLAWRTEDIIGD